ncbi:asparagine synthase (glutamine-hydrolyzing) [candidate division KSB1 bacterium]|nr:asparagine synthase (glutamine-hydrolyzing) [candidate division KSB1 bacterium]
MCGICGIIRTDEQPVDKLHLRDMLNSIRHRGPDDEGMWTNANVGLGHRRLSILDLSMQGHQPMSTEDQKVQITYNGEIYNYKDIRKILESKGYTFRSNTDSEVVLHAYQEWGAECLERFNGMFAIGIWDGVRHQLFLARDRLGIKPIFYYHDQNGLAFASEIKAILSLPHIKREMNYEALHHYLSLNYVPAPLTLFENILQLEPGQCLLFENHHLKTWNYWDLKFGAGNERKSERYYLNELNAHLERAVTMRMISDVPLGAFLSGGVDSTAVVAFMKQQHNEPVKTFTIGFQDASYNELPYAQIISDKLHTENYYEIIKPDAINTLEKIVWHSEEPTADASMIPIYFLSQMTRKHVTVALSGDGGDEIFAGYETYQASYLSQLYRYVPQVIRHNIVRRLLEQLPVSDKKMNFAMKARRFINGADYPLPEAHFHWRIIFNEREKRSLYNSDTYHRMGVFYSPDLYNLYFSRSQISNPLQQMLYTDTRYYLPNDMLVKVDRMSMAHGLEVRVPLLDHQLVEFMATVPNHFKLKYFIHRKYLLKKILAQRSLSIPYHRKKAGFNMPISRWIKEDLKEYTYDVLSSENINRLGIFNANVIIAMLNNHLRGKADHTYQIWSLLILMLWHNQFIAGKPLQ